MDIIKGSIEISKDLVYKNNPISIIVVDSKNTTITIESMDEVHKSMGMKMFGYHYFIDKEGNVYMGRPENAFACDIEMLMLKMYSNLISSNISPFDSVNMETENGSKVQSADRIFICLEGNTDNSGMSPQQRSSLVALSSDIRSRKRNIRNVYSLSEIYPQFNNLGRYVDFNPIRADIMNVVSPVYIDTPAGVISYTFGKRNFYYNPDNKMSGNDIKLLQLYFNLIGIPTVNNDGIYDAYMRNVVMSFQKSFNLKVDGNFDEDDFKVIINLINNLNHNISKDPYHRILYYRDFNPMFGEDVDYLESKLIDLRYLEGKNGYFTEDLKNAIIKYQKDNGLDADGKVGPLLWDLIKRDIPIFFTRIIKLTDPLMEGDDILIIQKKIKQIAKKYGIIAFNVNGKYDLITSKNIKKIQSMNNFSITGEINETFFNFLMKEK